ncbi:maleylpyruvate isomerase family mycothiol-dependent enzyme [Amycolatopsis sp. OK19-0408]|uniref:Maleylpyruvate isomerase family mycothiol-dependent enzyme n=1 Tax=Amycolatopsis iheyensis TaxID=2945988 RepID=A0A9X2SPW2_9PSEU|nr:maleylpyruvate isomerase family mycothiol-dependent enzyme [Amycolatopsis iheyensis]MCR6487915.1 maleylpyruvate isomerase family mycothiol-dependent enzyme [Amycolatopsis iheyensis]
MPDSGPWPEIHRERAALAADLAELPADAWPTPSLCREWTVHEVLGHVVATAKLTPVTFFARLAGSGFRFTAMTGKNIARETAAGPEATLAQLRAHADDTTGPPGPADSWLGEVVVHGTDIRWPLGLDRAFPAATLVRVAEFYRRSNLLIGAKNRVAGLALRATDADWSAGTGPEVSGPLLALVLAMTGRAAALDRLGGAGLEQLSARTS